MAGLTDWTPDIGDPRWERVYVGKLEVAWVFRGLQGAAWWARGPGGSKRFEGLTGSSGSIPLAKAAARRRLDAWWP